MLFSSLLALSVHLGPRAPPPRLSRAAVTARGLMTDEELDADVAACHAHLADPGTVVCS